MNQIFVALSDPTRRKILGLLAQGDLSAGQIAAQFTLSKPSISHHLAVLKQADLVESRREGQSLIYAIHTTVLADALTGLLNLVQPRTTRAPARGGPDDDRNA